MLARTLRASSRLICSPVVLARQGSTATAGPGPHPDPSTIKLVEYPNDTPAINAQFLSPHEKYWDQQGRRNFGEPLHEEADVLNIFTPDIHTVVTPRKALALQAGFAMIFVTIAGLVYLTWDGPPMVRRKYPYGGLERELGGLPGDEFPRAARIDESA
ncbi:hypothetical protein SAICODRAFT_7156 [Saitoella complicata NRRL Y-17804]|nr:uncharacterized protein SAICODRAFT_7156 [Saitoella complicata NRRL Y-17804]ODQ53442.1 hypothetical protein SAICODRAFT_7156 [Saitoella complicata NRRL Y-17804]